MRIAIYARVSSDTQAKEGTIESQIEALREYAKKHKYKIAYECLDDGYSGSNLDRPGLDELRDLMQAGEIKGVLILSLDRLSRNQANQIILMEEFKKRDIQVIFTNQNFEQNAEGNLMLTIQGAVAEYEREKILDRMRRGTIHAIKNGQINGGNPAYGYRYIPKTKDRVGHWEINPEEEKIVRYIYDLYVNEGLSATAIVKRLNDEAVPCRSSKWWSRQVFSILQKEFYIGIAYMFRRKAVEPKRNAKTKDYYKRKNRSRIDRPREDWVGIPVPAIIDREMWEKAQERRQKNIHTSKRNNRKNHYLLRGLVVCGLCGSMASGYVSNKSTYYSCRAKRGNNVHTIPHDELIQVSHPSFDDKVWVGLTELLSDPKKIKEQVGKRVQTRKSDNSPIGQPANEIDKELDKLAAQEQRLITAYRQEVINLDELKTQKGMIAERRKVLEAKKKAFESRSNAPEQPKITMAMLGDVSARFSRVMAKADFQTQEKIVNHLVNSVRLFTDKAIIRGNIPVDKFDALIPLPFGGGGGGVCSLF
ncbi:MAG: recombinase family protein [Anaerolineales bacterium]|nr:recombinase family protein [Anaerolineales bacterium]